MIASSHSSIRIDRNPWILAIDSEDFGPRKLPLMSDFLRRSLALPSKRLKTDLVKVALEVSRKSFLPE